MNKILLHICCGICSGWPIEKLRQDGYEVTGIFYNPNIHPRDEYERRLEAAKKACFVRGMELISAPYDCERWLSLTEDLKNEPEGGKRCSLCYRLRLEYTALKAKEMGIEYFTTTLSISPHKDSALINRIGIEIAGDGFKEYDFKKADGFKKSNRFSLEHGLYRQNYCGCSYNMR
ncbi:MAG: epoxyqueuosine reductase QueH [Candidatus Omnitrophica bacterium]|jgi:predicted adenine nucleotide alpha hydrolase (AANH) superfamily ATPase|nr:epoxyqueuosine reductase QueH [Candidatus Omnitrophota bacterium]MDD5080095.1 epoxyqueuosine reductase QueH [Candidatus Omnitrophota bacterium]